MPKKDNKILKCNHGEKFMKFPFIIYANMESLLEKMGTCHNNPKKSSTTKVNKHTRSGYSLFTCCSFHATKNNLDCYRGHDCMKKFCKDLKEYAVKIFNHGKKETIPLTYKQNKSYKRQKPCYICKKGFNIDDDDNDNREYQE